MIPRAILVTLMLLVVYSPAAFAVTLRDVTFVTKNAGTVTFSHQRHLQQAGLAGNCQGCHDRIFPLRKRVGHTMDAMSRGKSCGACHNGQAAFGLVACVRCHAVRTVTIPVKATGPVRFSHQQHLGGMPDCRGCHPAIFAAGRNRPTTMAAMQAGKSCGACHNGSKAFPLDNCAACHPTRELVFTTKGAGDTPFSHSQHLKVRRCDACHPRLYTIGKRRVVTMVAMEKGRSCGACHNGREASALADCGVCHLVKNREYQIAGAGDVKFDHQPHFSVVKSCSRCHLRLYPFGRIQQPVTMNEMVQGKSCGACHNGTVAFTVRESCARCHHVQ